MNLLESILEVSQGALVREMANSVGIDQSDATRAVRQLAPALARGLSRNARDPGGLDALLGALKSGSHQRYVDHPEELTRQENIADGNAILGHVFGSKDVSRNVAAHASRQTGLDVGLLKKLLPMVATAAMGSLSKETTGGGILGALGGGSQTDPGLAGVLEDFLDSDRDGAVMDDLLSLAKKFL